MRGSCYSSNLDTGEVVSTSTISIYDFSEHWGSREYTCQWQLTFYVDTGEVTKSMMVFYNWFKSTLVWKRFSFFPGSVSFTSLFYFIICGFWDTLDLA